MPYGGCTGMGIPFAWRGALRMAWARARARTSRRNCCRVRGIEVGCSCWLGGGTGGYWFIPCVFSGPGRLANLRPDWLPAAGTPGLAGPTAFLLPAGARSRCLGAPEARAWTLGAPAPALAFPFFFAGCSFLVPVLSRARLLPRPPGFLPLSSPPGPPGPRRAVVLGML
ncbi:uncharacterized protein GGS22DRAFT_162997 [Annulohypoxylon maeteangense]|uniref:uncharacterized protein n=1 Tax=Annulohypoxylon maeteangense TaxID=1927788 RepID=UPI002007D07A|nr:uncharacterized protein GGS22DRAFT_162997 [Annulohypoxylon maeteangense]KAI0885193.1 hypothetical protein GGS22DRAFT_162997 [Annulohypoxylon maeteangense]